MGDGREVGQGGVESVNGSIERRLESRQAMERQGIEEADAPGLRLTSPTIMMAIFHHTVQLLNGSCPSSLNEIGLRNRTSAVDANIDTPSCEVGDGGQRVVIAMRQ